MRGAAGEKVFLDLPERIVMDRTIAPDCRFFRYLVRPAMHLRPAALPIDINMNSLLAARRV